MKKSIEKLVNSLGKHSEFKFDEELTNREIIQIGFQMVPWFIRGIYRSFFFKRRTGLTFIGKNVRIRFPQHVSVGKNFLVEDFVEIMGLSHKGIVCGDNVTIGAYATIKPSSYYGKGRGAGLIIGDNSNIGRYAYIGCSGLITIGKNVMMGPRVGIFAENHIFDRTDISIKAQGVERKEVVIGDNCWIASNVTITAGVRIGQGSVIAGGSVVTQDVEPDSVVGGVPAKLISKRGVNTGEA